MTGLSFLHKHLEILWYFRNGVSHPGILWRGLFNFCQRKLHGAETEKPGPFRSRAFGDGLAVTYFRVRLHTSIGANPFHCPVRDGKEWVQAAMAAR